MESIVVLCGIWKTLSHFLIYAIIFTKTVSFRTRSTSMKPYDSSIHYASITSYYALSMIQYQMKPHSHDRHEIMYVTNGSCAVITDASKYTLHQHQFIFIAANIRHCLRVDESVPCSILNLEFMFQKEKTKLDIQELLEESLYFQKFFAETQNICIVGTDNQDFGYALKDLIHHLEQLPMHSFGYSSVNHFEEDYLSRLLFIRTLYELSRCISERKLSASTQYVKLACEYISEHFQENLQIPEIAAAAGINRSYLCTLFSQYQHCTILEYINRKRLEHAKFLLKTSSLTVTDIAFHSGFNSRQHFRTTFYKYEGINPTEYRHLNKRNLEASTGLTKRVLHESGVESLPLAGSFQAADQV